MPVGSDRIYYGASLIYEPSSDGFDLRADLASGTSADAGQVTVTASATPHTVGAWVEVAASTTAVANGVTIGLRAATSAAATDTSMLVDIGLGAAGSEVVLVSSVPIGWTITGRVITVPCPIPSGSRVAVRARSAVASKTADLTVRTCTGPTVVGTDTLGAVTASSRGTILGASTGPTNLGAWTELTASTTNAYEGILVSCQGGGDTTLTTGGLRVDIGTGAAASETLVGSTFWHVVSSENLYPVGPTFLPVAVLSGTRLVARQAGPSGGSVDVICHGVRL